MRPLKLEVQGFTAFRQFTTLDFTDLELFALVGPTGSGKSSLLDAMTFALYGQTARLGLSGLDALISQGERGMSASLTFEVSTVTYRASRTKGRKQAENEVRFEHLGEDGRWTNLSDGAGGVKGISERIRKAVGLDFDTFRRSVMLPQGEFSRLLLGKPADRQALLGELTGLDHVQGMQKIASDRAKELKHESTSLNSVLDSEYAGVTPDALAALRREREVLSAEAERLTDERERLQTAVTRLRDLEKVWRNREETSRRLTGLQARADSVQDGAERAARARRVAGVLPLLDAAERARIAQEREARELSRAQLQADAATEAAGRAAAILTTAQAQESRIPNLEAKAETLKDAEADAARLKRGGGTPQTTHPQPLPWDEDTFHTAREAAQKLEKVKQDRVKLSARRLGLTALKETQTSEVARLDELERAQTRVQQEGKSARAAYQQSEAALKAARTHAGIAAYREHLHAGAPCPLCEQIVHAVPPGDDVNTAALERAVETAKAELEGRLLLFKENTLQIEHLKKVTGDRASTIADTEGQLTEEEEDNRLAEGRIHGDPQTDVLRLLASLAERVRRAGSDPAGQRQQHLKDIQAIRRGVQDAQAALSRAQGDVAATGATLTAARTTTAARTEEAGHAQTALDKALSSVSLDATQARAAALPETDITALEEQARTHSALVAQPHSGWIMKSAWGYSPRICST
ncbi:SMC family ATPase, partial [Deinococcus sp.]|uniref:SMC family ATPase n=1 Tax=Deinococcus sp. TaxID=47478 RepID=UPI002869A8FF